MIALLQRVSLASIETGGETIAEIGAGILALIAVQPGDTKADAEHMAGRILHYRIFNDAEGRMNLCLSDINGGLLLVPQFTLAADTRKGTRPGFSSAAEPRQAGEMFAHLADCAERNYPNIARGRFGADMRVRLINEGPATFLLQTGPR